MVGEVALLPLGFEPTYKELKRRMDDSNADKGYQSFEPTYKELKLASGSPEMINSLSFWAYL